MVNEHVKDAQYTASDSHQQGFDSDDEFAYRAQEPMTISDWETYYSEDLYNMWRSLRAYGDTTGARAYCMEHATYTDFVEWCYEHSSKCMYFAKVGTK